MKPRLKILMLSLAAASLGGAAYAASADWRRDAAPEDRLRVQRLDEAWRLALRQAQDNPKAVKALGSLVRRDAALTRPEPAPGDYRCRTVKLGGGERDAGLGVIAYGWFKCRVELTPGGDLILKKVTGSQRPIGNLYPDTRRRLVYLGAVAWGEETSAAYRRDPERDQAGVFERIGPQHYRLVLPLPKQESTLDILELRR